MKPPMPNVMPSCVICSSLMPNIPSAPRCSALALGQLGGDAQAQGIEANESVGVGLVVGAGIVLEGGDARVEQRIGLRIAADDDDIALVELDADPAVHDLLGVVDQHLQRLALRRPPVAV